MMQGHPTSNDVKIPNLIDRVTSRTLPSSHSSICRFRGKKRRFNALSLRRFEGHSRTSDRDKLPPMAAKEEQAAAREGIRNDCLQVSLQLSINDRSFMDPLLVIVAGNLLPVLPNRNRSPRENFLRVCIIAPPWQPPDFSRCRCRTLPCSTVESC